LLTAQLSLHNVTRRYDDHIVLDAVSFTVKPGEKAGIIGDNGAGKSTLLRLLAGHDRPDNGEVTVVAPDGVGHLAQSLALPQATVQDAIDLALADLRDLESRMRAAETELHGPAGAALAAALDAYAGLTARYEARGGYAADTRVDISHASGPSRSRRRVFHSLGGRADHPPGEGAAGLGAQP
jgi:macrolide transport system ATP-binding/permease protein